MAFPKQKIEKNSTAIVNLLAHKEDSLLCWNLELWLLTIVND